MFLLFVRVLPSVAIAEVKLLLKTSSEQSKKKLIDEGHLDESRLSFTKKSLTSLTVLTWLNTKKYKNEQH
jgi:hypothetical protein